MKFGCCVNMLPGAEQLAGAAYARPLKELGYGGGVSIEAPVSSPEAWRGMAETNLRLLREAFGDQITEGPEKMGYHDPVRGDRA